MIKKLYTHAPERIIDDSGLTRALTDTNANRFDAKDRKIGSELIIDYPHELGRGFRIIIYEVTSGNNGKYWREVKRQEWVSNPKISFAGHWQDGWN